MPVREISGIDELRAVEALQKEVWSVADLEVLPAVHMIAAREVGAILIGAFEGADLIGFVYGFPGFEGDHRVIHSDMLAVREGRRDQGVGRALKLAQREAARERGVEAITWTFDPLQARNAYLNFATLGVTANRYLRDFYGSTTSPLHRLGTDRLWVTWPVMEQERTIGGDPLRIQIPSNINTLADDEASRWRDKTRSEFEDAFAKGWIATGFERGAASCSYLLSRGGSVSPDARR